jgi:DNA repair exonuclease SbcCD ATPase subunit
MALRGQHHLLLQELHEVADCFAKPQVSHAVRLQKSTQLRACIERVQVVCGELHETKAGHRQLQERAALAERLQRELDTTTARLKDHKERADALQAKLLDVYSGSAPDAQSLARQVDELEEALRRKTVDLERGAGQQTLRAQVEGLQRELDKRADELREAQAQTTSTQKQLWQARDSYSKLNVEHQAEAGRHQHEVERLRHQIAALERQGVAGGHHRPPQPQRQEQPMMTTRQSQSSSVSVGLDSPRVSVAVGGSPMEEVEEALAPDAARYRRQLNLERREHARCGAC